jgi:predicted nucleic-acid-binding protein
VPAAKRGVYVLESFYEVKRSQVAGLARAILAFPAVTVIDASLLLRAVEVYEVERIDFAEAYLVAGAEGSGVNETPRSTGRSIGYQRFGASSQKSPRSAQAPVSAGIR